MMKYTSNHLPQWYHLIYHMVVVKAYMIILANVYMYVINIVVYFVSIIMTEQHLR